MMSSEQFLHHHLKGSFLLQGFIRLDMSEFQERHEVSEWLPPAPRVPPAPSCSTLAVPGRAFPDRFHVLQEMSGLGRQRGSAAEQQLCSSFYIPSMGNSRKLGTESKEQGKLEHPMSVQRGALGKSNSEGNGRIQQRRGQRCRAHPSCRTSHPMLVLQERGDLTRVTPELGQEGQIPLDLSSLLRWVFIGEPWNGLG